MDEEIRYQGTSCHYMLYNMTASILNTRCAACALKSAWDAAGGATLMGGCGADGTGDGQV